MLSTICYNPLMIEAKRRYELENMYDRRLRGVPGKDAKQHSRHHFATVVTELGDDPKVAETIFEIVERYGAISAERLLEGSAGNLATPGFNFFQFAGLFGEAHRRIGRLAAGYWASSYGEIVKTGYDPDEYFGAVDKMAELGGNRISGYFAYVFPDLLKSGQNPYTARSYTTQIVRRAGIPSARSFLLNAADVASIGGIDVETYGRFSVHALDDYGKKLGYWIIRGSAGAVLCGVPLDTVKEDVETLLEKYPKNGEKVASWLVAGYSGLGETKKTFDEDVQEERKLLARVDPSKRQAYAYRIKSVAEAQASSQQFDIYIRNYKNDYLRLVNEVGLSGGVYLSRATSNGLPTWRRHETPQLRVIPEKLIEARSVLSKQALSKVLWFGPRLFHRPEAALKLIDDCIWAATDFGEKVMLEGLVFSAKRVAKSGVGGGLELPHGTGKLLSGEEDEEGSWQNLLNSGTIFEADDDHLDREIVSEFESA